MNQPLPSTPSSRAMAIGLQFPVGRLHRKLKQRGAGRTRVGAKAAVYMAAVLEYLLAELFEMAVEKLDAGKKTSKRLTPRHFKLAIEEDVDFINLIHAYIPGGGVLPAIHPRLLSNQPWRMSAGSSQDAQEPPLI